MPNTKYTYILQKSTIKFESHVLIVKDYKHTDVEYYRHVTFPVLRYIFKRAR